MAYASKRKAVAQLTPPASKRQATESACAHSNMNKSKSIETETPSIFSRLQHESVKVANDYRKVRFPILGKYITKDAPAAMQQYDTMDLMPADPRQLHHSTSVSGPVAQDGKRPAIVRTPYNRDRKLTFFDLAPELRNEIYKLSLISAEGIAIMTKNPNNIEPALLFSSKKIRSEALNMFYHNNSFHFDDTETAIGFLKALRRIQRNSLQSFTIIDPFKAAVTPVEAELEDARIRRYDTEYHWSRVSSASKAAQAKLQATLDKSPRALKKFGPLATPVLPPGMEYIHNHLSNFPHLRQKDIVLDKPRTLKATKHALRLLDISLGRKEMNNVVKVEMLVHVPVDENRPANGIGEAKEEWRAVTMKEVEEYKVVEVRRRKYVMPMTEMEKSRR
ncbi:hypothetical protein CB0940_07188 [Cercospora beticola]|uniref:Uncharacterized protein n=1 Tax=Cercospora beticola TaxID=122368 RepID=A0A2G5H952_CERBT|nr:hypothetical protein CB0940_07188 [Cercospora beticola]PIA89064.1 hypothetical protein CB0940_07188 [Cercospora beticola]WPB03117.1 hypothetical protein RHO25_007754 [Cercospora beticola]CAK1358175.1 unnamed protein product [Cercospora beticola]